MAVVIDVTQFGVAVVYLLLSSKNIRDFLQAFFDIDFSYCIVVLILALCLLPVTFLKSPQDFWFVPLHSISSELLKCRNFLSIAKMLRSAITPSVSIRKKHIFHSLLLPFLSRLRMIRGRRFYRNFQQSSSYSFTFVFDMELKNPLTFVL